MKLDLLVNGKTLEANCSELYRLPAEQLLRDLASMKILLERGTEIHYGWILLRLTERDGNLVVTAPDIDGKNIEVFQDELDTALRVLVEQAVILKFLGCDSLPALYKEKVTLYKNILDYENRYLERLEKVSPNDSGWYIGVQDEDSPSKENLITAYVFELALMMPEVMRIMALPIGYLVTMESDRITQIYDTDNNPCLKNPESLPGQ
jgi:hypothetical protein